MINELLQKELLAHAKTKSTWRRKPDPKGHDRQPFKTGPLDQPPKLSYLEVTTAGEKWIPVVRSFNKKKKSPTTAAMAPDLTYESPNRFSPLINLNGNPSIEKTLKSNYKRSSAANSTRKNTIQPRAGNTIPTIINGQVAHIGYKRLSSSPVNSSRFPGNKVNKRSHKVKIIGDSHLRGSAIRVSQYLNKIRGRQFHQTWCWH